MPPLFNRVVIVGVGLIGSSIGMNLVKKRLAREVIGVGRSRSNLREAIRRRAIHRFVVVGANLPVRPHGGRHRGLPLQDLSEDDLVILATPVKEIIHYLRKIFPPPYPLPRGEGKKGRVGPLVTDVGSTKQSIIKEAVRRKLRFVGSHPIAGTERSGAAAGELDLFQGRLCLLTPTRFSRRTDLLKVKHLWKEIGSETVLIDPKRHDRLLAAVSHLPHLVVYALVGAVSGLVSLPEEVLFALGGLKGTTRIAASPPEMWRDIFLDNRKFILLALTRFEKEVRRLRTLMTKRNSKRLFQTLQRARKVRLKFS